MSSATASRPMNSLLMAALMITSTMAMAMTAVPWATDIVQADGTSDGSEASDNSSNPSQVIDFDVDLNGTLDSNDQQDWYYVELFSGDTLDLGASCFSAGCGIMMQSSNSTWSYNLTTNSSHSTISYYNGGSTSFNFTFGFTAYALMNLTSYSFKAKVNQSQTWTGVYGDLALSEWNGQQVTGSPPSNFSAGNHSLAWEAYNLSNNGTYRVSYEINIDNNWTYGNYSLNTTQSYNTIPFTLQVLDSYCYISIWGDLYWEDSGNSTWLDYDYIYSAAPCVGSGGGSNGTGNQTNGTSQNDMGTGGDIYYAQITNFGTQFSGSVGGNDSVDMYYIWLNSGDHLTFDANCNYQNSNCSVMLNTNDTISGQFSYHYLTNNWNDTVVNVTNTNSGGEWAYFTFSAGNTIEHYDFYAQIYNNNSNGTGNGSGGNGTGNGSGGQDMFSGDLSIDEVSDFGIGNGANFSFEFEVEGMNANNNHDIFLGVVNSTMDEVYFTSLEGFSGNTTAIISFWEAWQGAGVYLADGCYLVFAEVYDTTDGEYYFDSDTVGVHSTCTSVLADAHDDHVAAGDDLEAVFHVYDASPNSNYTIDWWFEDDNGSVVSTGSLTSYSSNYSMYEEEADLSTNGLADGCYILDAELNENGTAIVNSFSWPHPFNFEVGTGFCGEEDISVYTDQWHYYLNETVSLNIEAYDLNEHENYSIIVDIFDDDGNRVGGTTQSNGLSVTNSDWGEWNMNFSAASDGCYTVDVFLEDSSGNQLSSDFTAFEVGSGCNLPQPSLDVWNEGDHWSETDYIGIDYDIEDLALNHTYKVDWVIKDKQDWNSVMSGYDMFTNVTSESYSGQINATGLATGCYEIQVELIGYHLNSSIYWVSSDWSEFSVGDIDCTPLGAYVNSYDIGSGDNASFTVSMENLNNGSTYDYRIVLDGPGGMVSEYNSSVTAYSDSMSWTHHFGSLSDGCYGGTIYVIGDDDQYTRNGFGFKVGDPHCGSGHIDMLDDRKSFPPSNNTMFEMEFGGFPSNQSVQFEYYTRDWRNGQEGPQGSFNLTFHSDDGQNYILGLGNLSTGCYDLIIDWFDSSGQQHSAHAGFAVGPRGDCYGEEVHVGPASSDWRDHYDNGETVDLRIKVEEMKPDHTYSLDFWHEEDGITINSGTLDVPDGNMMAILNYSMTPADDVCTTFRVTLLDDGMAEELTSSDFRFATGDGDCWPPRIDSWYDDYDGVLNVHAGNLDEGEDYAIRTVVYDEDGNYVWGTMEREFSWEGWMEFHYDLTNLSAGCYNSSSQLMTEDYFDIDTFDGDVFSIGEVDCWSEPGINYVDWDGFDSLNVHVYDLRVNDTYELQVDIYTSQDGQQGDLDSSANYTFVAIPELGAILMTFDLEDYTDYYASVELLDEDGNLLADYDSWFYTHVRQPGVKIIEFNETGTDDDLIFSVEIDDFRDGVAYSLEVEVLRKVRDGGDDLAFSETTEVSLEDGEDKWVKVYTVSGLSDGFYHIEADLVDMDSDDQVSGDHRGICIGDGCPPKEPATGTAGMTLNIAWPDKPENMADDHCWEMRVELIPVDRWQSAHEGETTYGAYPDWWISQWDVEWENDEGTTQESDGIPSGEFVVRVKVDCYNDEFGGYSGVQSFDNMSSWMFSDGQVTVVDLVLETMQHGDDHGDDDDDNIFDFLEDYFIGEFEYQVGAVRNDDQGSQLIFTLQLSLDSSIIEDLDEEFGDGDGQISAEEQDEINDELGEMQQDFDEIGEEFRHDGEILTAGEYRGTTFSFHGLDGGQQVHFTQSVSFAIPSASEVSASIVFEDAEDNDLCDFGEDARLQFVALNLYDEYYPTNASADGVEMVYSATSGALTHVIECGDAFPQEVQVNFNYDDQGSTNGSGGDGNETTNSAPFCYISWYKSGDDLTGSGEAILTAGDSIEDITVKVGDTFTVYIECEDPDGDDISLKISPPFGSSLEFTGNGVVNEFMQFTVPTGFSGKFEFDAEWSDAASGGDFVFDVIVEPSDGEGEEEDQTENDDAAAASFVPGFTGVFAVAAFLGAVLVLARREEE